MTIDSIEFLKLMEIHGMTRPVTVFRFDFNTQERTESYKGVFHKFGLDYEGGDMPVSYSTAIVESEFGVVENVPVQMIRFDDRKTRQHHG